MTLVAEQPISTTQRRATVPRLGFLGVGWIGRNRMEAIARSGHAEIAAIADASEEVRSQAAAVAPEAIRARSVEELLDLDLDGIVIATPSALHAEQARAAFQRGLSVFCQKPLGRTAEETRQVIEAAKDANRLLGVDLSYRGVAGVQQMRKIIQSGELGKIFAVDVLFHNAYGPDKPWFYNPQLSGGGCVIDLGIHLVDLALWCMDFPQIERVTSRLFAKGEPLAAAPNVVEDFAAARLDIENGPAIQLSCSWKLPAGCDAIIRASFYGTNGGIEFRNVNGSFYDFVVERMHGTKRELLAGPPDQWGGRAAVDWARQLSEGATYNPEIGSLIDVAEALDRIYGR